MAFKPAGTLRFVLGDQLSLDLPSLRDLDPSRDVVLMAEVMDEATYVRHHPKKIAFLFSAMRHFADGLRDRGITVDYVPLDESANRGGFRDALAHACARHTPDRIAVTAPGEYRVEEDMRVWQDAIGRPVDICEDTRFLCSRHDFADWARGKRSLRMETFYREMRKRTGLLMTKGGEPEGGRWNYDAENRKPPPSGADYPAQHKVEADGITREVLDLVERRFGGGYERGGHFGELHPFHFGVTRDQALGALDTFVDQRLPFFGDYQDAMVEGEDWMFHSVLGLYLNAGLLGPMEVCRKAEAAYYDGQAPLNAVEGFIRQILGWREYIRGLYWLKMPEYETLNFFNATRPVPEWWWTAKTPMNCLHQVIDQSRRQAYAHHIQRLMVTGNFALLAGLDPVQVNEWYLVVYADAYQWVELPNVTGMALFADGGYMASKPYAASGAYIDRMSDYCKSCIYSPKVKTGPKACPFNYLYWYFLMENRDVLRKNQRVAPIYGTLDRMKDDKVRTIRANAESFLSGMGDGRFPDPADAKSPDKQEQLL